jgi:RloB-like protein
MKPQRLRNPRPRKMKLLVVCEGKSTEFTYLDGLCQEQGVQDRFAPQLRRGRGGDARVVVQAAINERDRQRHRDEAYEEVWCVLDVEGIEETARLNEAITLARIEHIHLALSNPSFEVWLIAHFTRTSRQFPNSKAAETYLEQQHWRPVFGCDYEKGAPELYTRLASRVNDAIENARAVLEQHHEGRACKDCNSSTEVYCLASKLLGPH